MIKCELHGRIDCTQCPPSFKVYEPPQVPEPFKHARLMCAQDKGLTHFSHLHQYVSAYETSPLMMAELEQAIIEAYLRLRKQGHGSELVDQDGEMQLQVCQGGQIKLLLPWKQYDMEVETMLGSKRVRDMSTAELREYLEIVRQRREKLTLVGS